jgi:propanol-preferring alcohol dehydrogenase
MPMRALRLLKWKSDPVLLEVDEPVPGPGEAVVRVGGAGACHSDLHLMREFGHGLLPWGPPFTLQPKITTYSLERAMEAYRDLEAGRLEGRAVVVPA